jgi:hypothetical protein
MIAAFSGHVDNSVDIPDDAETTGAARMIQKKYRNMKHKKQSPADRVKRVRAAIAIQRFWRGFLRRKKFRTRRRPSDGGDAGSQVGLDNPLALFLPNLEPEPPLPFRLRVWMFMEDSESSFGAKIMSLGIMTTIIVSIVAFNLQTMPELREVISGNAWYVLECFCTIVFTCEYVVRLSVCTEGGVSMKKWIVEPSNMCDFLAIVPFYVELLRYIPDPRPVDESGEKRFSMGMGGVSSGQVMKTFRLVRLFRLFRILKLGRYSSGMQLMFQTIKNSGAALMLLVFLLSVLVVVFGTQLFYLERFSCPLRDKMGAKELFYYDDVCMDENGFMQSGYSLDGVLCCDKNSRALDFGNIAHACWLAIVTMTTVGYGDLYPKTFQGRLVGVVCMFSGILLIALPTAIVGQNFQEVYRHLLEQQAKTMKRRVSKQFSGAIAATKKMEGDALVRRSSKELLRRNSSGPANPQYVSWKRIQILSARSNSRNIKLKALQAREQRMQEQLKTEIRSLVQLLESHPLRSESVT